jgi:hypothetical protein
MTKTTNDSQDLFDRNQGAPRRVQPEHRPALGGDPSTLGSALSAQLNDSVVRMLAYNGSIPGPTLHVDQGSNHRAGD